MGEQPLIGEGLSRREVLEYTGLAAVSAFLAACSGSSPNSVPSLSPSDSAGRTKSATQSPPESKSWPFKIPGVAITADLLKNMQTEQQVYDYLGLAVERGVEVIRTDWDGAAAGIDHPSDINWEPTDMVAHAAKRRGLGIVALFSYVPESLRQPRAEGEPDPAYYANPPTEAGVDAMAEFAYKATLRHGLKWGEGFNEPNTSFVGAWPELNVQLNRKLNAAMKRANPNAQYSIGGLAPSDSSEGKLSPVDYLKALYHFGMLSSDFDAIAIHPYCFPALPGQNLDWSAFWQIEDAFKDGKPYNLFHVLNNHHDRRKKILITEFGTKTIGTGIEATLDNQHFDDFNSKDDGYTSVAFQIVSIGLMIAHRFNRANVPRARFAFTLSEPSKGFGIYDAHGNLKQPEAPIAQKWLDLIA